LTLEVIVGIQHTPDKVLLITPKACCPD